MSAPALRIGIDAHGVGGHSAGLGNETYFRNLIAALLALDPVNEYHLFANHPEALAPLVAGRPNARIVALRPASQWIQRPFSLPMYANRAGLDVLHVPFVMPPFVRARTVVTVHDISFESFPEHYRAIERARMKVLVPWSCRHADLVLTVSEFSRRQIGARYGVPEERIVVTYNAADHAPHAPHVNGSGPAAARFEPPSPYVLYVGMIQPRKNLVRLVEAFDRLRTEHGVPHHLVLAGKMGWGNDALLRRIGELRHAGAIHLTGYLPDTEMERLLAGAAAFAFPSLFEAFGIPPLEAQRAGVPVLVSDGSCFPEIYGDSVLYCDPLSVPSIAAGLARLLSDAPLRATLVARAHARAGLYSWERTASIALDAYRRLAAGARGTRR